MRVLLPVVSKEVALLLLPFTHAMLEGREGEIILVGVVEVPEWKSLSEGAGEAQKRRQELRELVDEHPELPLRALERVHVAHVPWSGILEDIIREKVDLVALPWSGKKEAPMLGVDQNEVLQRMPCDVVMVVRPEKMLGARKILVPLRGGPQASLALGVATAIARTNGGRITLLHVMSEEERASWPETSFTDFLDVVSGIDVVDRHVTLAQGEVADGILEEIAGHEVVVMGVSVLQDGEKVCVGDLAARVAMETDRAVVIVSKAGASRRRAARRIYRRSISRVGAPVRLSTLVDKWFAENTFHSTEFADLDHLVELKREQGVTISLGLPALNEEETIGAIIESVKGTLQERYPLLDEIVLIDSNSTDYTREIARSLGVPVYIHQEILSDEVGSYAGKGEALWKSLYVLNGDIIVWVDTDIKNFHPRFVYGVIGPLLLNPRIKYVKGFYRRPLRVGDRIQAGGGGRVTELVARPMFNLFFPRLSGLIQPLSGEYAGRRELLERLPFFTGYGVETGLLIDILAREGLWAIAQSDLIERIHRNQSLSSLSRMAHAIIQVFIARLEARHKIELVADINKSMKLIRLKDRHYFLEEVNIIERERPPMIEVPAYRQKWEILDDEIGVGQAWGNGLER